MPAIRSFVAVDTPAEVKERMIVLSERLKATGADVKWEPKEKLHITVKFLGHVEEKRLESLANRLGGHLQTFPSFSLIYRGVGCFPSLHRPRVIWVGAEDKDGVLQKIQEKVEEIASGFGLEKEERTFHPHVTIGRVKGSRNLENLVGELERADFEPQASNIHEVLLMKSDLRPTGSVYSVLRRYELLKI